MESTEDYNFPNTPTDYSLYSVSESYIDSGLSGSEYNYNSCKSTPNTSLLQTLTNKNSNSIPVTSTTNTLTSTSISSKNASSTTINSSSSKHHAISSKLQNSNNAKNIQNIQVYGNKLKVHQPISKSTNFNIPTCINSLNKNSRPVSSSSERSTSSVASSGIGLSFKNLNLNGGNRISHPRRTNSHQVNTLSLNTPSDSNQTQNGSLQLKQTHKLYKTIHKQTRKRELQQQKEQLQKQIKSHSPTKSSKLLNENQPKIFAQSSASITDDSGVVSPGSLSLNSIKSQKSSERHISGGTSNVSDLSLESIDHSRKKSGDEVPLPELTFIDSKKLWNSMIERSKKPIYQINFNQHNSKHPQVTSKMRAVLIDWLIDVCQVYQLHRETFHMSLDFLARYMALTDKPIKRQTLQLVGVTALFVASKLEEIHPPKAKDFAYVTDGACSIQQIKDFEMELSKTLSWNLQPVTAQNWLSLFLQIAQFKKNNINTELIVINPSLNDLDISNISLNSNSNNISDCNILQRSISSSSNTNLLDVSGQLNSSIMSPKMTHNKDEIKYEYHGSYWSVSKIFD